MACVTVGEHRPRQPPKVVENGLVGPTTNPTTFGPSSGGFIPSCSGLPAWMCSFSVIFRQRPLPGTPS